MRRSASNVRTLAGCVFVLMTGFCAPVYPVNAVPVRSVESLAALKAQEGFDSPVVVAGYRRAGDGGGGTFVWSPASTGVADDIVTVAVSGRDTGRWQRQMSTDGLSILACGGTTAPDEDNSPVIEKCLAVAPEVILPKGDFRVSDRGINVPSGRTLRFMPGARLVMLPSDKPNYEILRIRDVSSVNILDPVIIGDKYIHRGLQGEWGMGISIRGGKKVRIVNARISRCWGDALYIGQGDGPSDGVSIESAVLTDNRRQGISIISGKSLSIRDAVITDTRSDNAGVVPLPNGPHAGIDIEPNDSVNEIGVEITNLQTARNLGPALAISLKGLTKGLQGEKKVSIVVAGHKDDGSREGFLLGGWQTDSGNITGQIRLSGQQYFNNKRSAITVIDYPASMPVVLMDAPYLKNWAGSGLKSTKLSSAISIFNYAYKGDIGSIEINAPVLERTTPLNAWNDSVIYGRQSVKEGTLRNVRINNPRLIGVSPVGHFWGQGLGGGLELRQE